MRIPGWIIADAVLLIAAAICFFLLMGYTYVGYTLVLIAGMILIYHVAPVWLWRLAVTLVGIGLIYLLVLEIPIVSSSRTDRDCKKDYLIVLGAEVVGNRPSRSLNYRINEAYSYLTEYPGSYAIVSGGKGEGENITEAQCMFDNLVARGISPDRIIMEDRATSTKENLSFSFDIIRSRGEEPSGNVAILSSSYHLFRAKRMAANLGVDAAGVACYPGNPFLALNFFIREAFGVTHLMIFGR